MYSNDAVCDVRCAYSKHNMKLVENSNHEQPHIWINFIFFFSTTFTVSRNVDWKRARLAFEYFCSHKFQHSTLKFQKFWNCSTGWYDYRFNNRFIHNWMLNEKWSELFNPLQNKNIILATGNCKLQLNDWIWFSALWLLWTLNLFSYHNENILIVSINKIQ